MRRIIELGNYIVPAYAGMILAEQGHAVVKWTNDRDPIKSLKRGEELWDWINHGKRLDDRHPQEINEVHDLDIVIDNFRASTLEKWSIDPEKIARERNCVWVSVRSEVGEVSFDILAQARSTREASPYIPFYIGDTSTGLWLAFKALAAEPGRHYVLGHASCMQKLVEGELIVDIERNRTQSPWDDEGTYTSSEDSVHVEYKNQQFDEPVRDREWKLKHLFHKNGRIII